MPNKYLLIYDDTPSAISGLAERKIKARSELLGRELTAEEVKKIKKQAEQGDDWQSNPYYIGKGV